jgi:6-pyruvoyltetrahydropterin/6-carboxytetrahydropterin synthase
VLADLDYRNLDDHQAFAGRLSTTEVVAQHIAEQVLERIPAEHLVRLRVLLREHPDAWAAYTVEL